MSEKELKTLLIQNIRSKTQVSEKEADIINAAYRPLVLKKKKDLLRAGEVCQNMYFIGKGCLRSYLVDTKGAERIYQIGVENHWIGDLYSFYNQVPSELYIETIEQSALLMISHDRLEQLFLEVPKLERFYRILFQRAYTATLHRLHTALTETAQSRYQALVEKQPDLIRRVPLIYIASYLGITPESLSRIRKQSS